VDRHLGRPGGTSGKLLTCVQDRAGHDRTYAIDARKSRAELGWRSEDTFKAEPLKTVECYLAQGERRP
jgi:dTDP-glucose 4,6-dehydratase